MHNLILIVTRSQMLSFLRELINSVILCRFLYPMLSCNHLARLSKYHRLEETKKYIVKPMIMIVKPNVCNRTSIELRKTYSCNHFRV